MIKSELFIKEYGRPTVYRYYSDDPLCLVKSSTSSTINEEFFNTEGLEESYIEIFPDDYDAIMRELNGEPEPEPEEEVFIEPEPEEELPDFSQEEVTPEIMFELLGGIL